MSPRPDGFNIMDVSTSIHDDPKFRRLARTHPGLYASAYTVYTAVLAASWKMGERVPVDDAWPLLLPYDQAVVDALMVELLDGEGRVPEHVWQAHYWPAYQRREARRGSGKLGGLKSAATRVVAPIKQRSSNAQPVRPSFRSVRQFRPSTERERR
jgi:hypothetical protein